MTQPRVHGNQTKTYTAKRLPRHNGLAAWRDILPPLKAAAPLEQDITADFAVVGAGFAGLSAARRLGQLNPGAKIVVLEAGALAEGAAGRNSGFMIDLPHDLASDDYAGQGEQGDREMIRLNRQAIDFAREAVAEYGINPAYFDPVGKVNGAASPAGVAHNAAYAGHLARLGEPAEVLDARDMADMTGSSYYLSGLYTPGTVMLQPAGYIQQLAQGVRQKATIYENSPVTSFARLGPDWQINCPQGKVTTPKIVLSVNGHLESFGFVPGRLMHIFLFAAMTPDLDTAVLKTLGGRSRWGITPADPMGTTLRRIDSAQGGNRIITRSCAIFAPDMQTSPRELATAQKVLHRKFAARFPNLSGLKMDYSWAGHLCLSKNKVSVMRELEENVFAACCQNGLGTTRGTLTGMGAAELASGQTSDITRAFATQAVPEKLPPQPFSSIGATAYLRWKEWRAGKE
ncbi:FAD-binding oxidoreductase [Kiloniella laminariae]|uniref:FAD-binding oxidoreductase n=1 Tax=Kiloniella laminariae TaxID=454162 RepID=A0ABT4LF58_9PROT|nr:FAD-binding oxidoreductase [Kiloniella laminariae]MCZ4279737.1 FAD-binding oxidoreductase [Kiloniella laminariae]